MHRLKTRPQFQAVLSGRTIAKTEHFALHCCALGLPVATQGGQSPLFSRRGAWIGAMVPKRWAKRAVTRNAIKRQIYNVSAEFEAQLPEQAHVVRLRLGFDRAFFSSATSDVLKAAVRAELMHLFSRLPKPSTP